MATEGYGTAGSIRPRGETGGSPRALKEREGGGRESERERERERERGREGERYSEGWMHDEADDDDDGDDDDVSMLG